MSKSTQDLVHWLNQVADQLEEDMISVQIFTDKSYRIYVNGYDKPVFDSDDQDKLTDCNDLAYEDPVDFSDFLRQVIQDMQKDPIEAPAAAAPSTES